LRIKATVKEPRSALNTMIKGSVLEVTDKVLEIVKIVTIKAITAVTKAPKATVKQTLNIKPQVQHIQEPDILIPVLQIVGYCHLCFFKRQLGKCSRMTKFHLSI
jgi:hypothetical protein